MRVDLMNIKCYLMVIVNLLVLSFAQNIAAHERVASEAVPRMEKNKGAVDDFDEICGRIKNLLLTGEFRKFSVKYDEPELGRLEYRIQFDGSGGPDRLQALCGNGSDAICEMTLTTALGGDFQFSLPATIRVIMLDRQIYIINGVIISPGKKVEARQYTVHKLLPNVLLLACSKF